MAMPQYAIAQFGSLVVIAVKAFTASSYQNECSNAAARSKSAWTAGAHDTGKWTLPSLSPSCADTTGAITSSSTVSAMARWRAFMTSSFSSEWARGPGRSLVHVEAERQAAGVAPLGWAPQGVVPRALHVAEQSL